MKEKKEEKKEEERRKRILDDAIAGRAEEDRIASTKKDIVYLGNPTIFKGSEIKKGETITVNEREYNELIRNRNFQAPDDYAEWKIAWGEREAKRIKDAEKLKKEAKK